MNRRQFENFAVDIQDETTGLWHHGFIADISDDGNLLVDFFVPGQAPVPLPVDQLFFPPFDSEEDPEFDFAQSGEHVEILVRLKETDKLTWYPAVVLMLLSDPDIMFAKVEDSEEIVAVNGFSYVRFPEERMPVEEGNFQKRTVQLPDSFEWTGDERSFMARWHQVLWKTKIIARNGRSVEFVARAMNDDDLLDGETLEALVGRLHSSVRTDPMADIYYQDDEVIFWHGDIFPKGRDIEDHAALITSRSFRYSYAATNALALDAAPKRKGPRRSYISSIPDELLVTIFRYLDILDQKTLQRVNYRWNTLLQSENLQRVLILDLPRFKTWVLGPQTPHVPRAIDGWMSLEFVYTLLRTVTKSVKHLVLLSELPRNGTPLRLVELLGVLHASTVVPNVKFNSITVVDAKPLEWEIGYEGVACFPEEMQKMTKKIRFDKVQFRTGFGESMGQNFCMEFPVNSGKLLLPSRRNMKFALFDMFDGFSGEFPEKERLQIKDVVMKEDSTYKRKYTDAFRGTVLYEESANVEAEPVYGADGEELPNVEDWMKFRPFFLRSLKWALQKDAQIHRHGKELKRVRRSILHGRIQRNRIARSPLGFRLRKFRR